MHGDGGVGVGLGGVGRFTSGGLGAGTTLGDRVRGVRVGGLVLMQPDLGQRVQHARYDFAVDRMSVDALGERHVLEHGAVATQAEVLVVEPERSPH